MKSNVCYNLSKSEYITEFKGYKFYFSSFFNNQRFKSRIVEFTEAEKLKLNAKYRTNIDAYIITALLLYRTIEKRGFYVIDDRGLPLPKNYEAVVILV